MTAIEVATGRSGLILYRQGERNRCPGCHREHWHVGRASAECAFCGYTLPFPPVDGMTGTGTFTKRGRGGGR